MSGKVGRPRIVYSPETATRVYNASRCGLNQEQIARLVRMGRDVLVRLYRSEIDDGRAEGDEEIALSLQQLACGAPAVYEGRRRVKCERLPDKTVAVFLGKARLGMKEAKVIEHANSDGQPFAVRLLPAEAGVLPKAD